MKAVKKRLESEFPAVRGVRTAEYNGGTKVSFWFNSADD